MKKITLEQIEGPIDTFCLYMCPQPVYNYLLYIQSMIPAITPQIGQAVKQYRTNHVPLIQRLPQSERHYTRRCILPRAHLSECDGSTASRGRLHLLKYEAFDEGRE